MENKSPKLSSDYYFNVTDDQIHEHQKRSVREILSWLETTNEFIYRMQTPEERKRMQLIRKGEF
jgi:hypothetical protein